MSVHDKMYAHDDMFKSLGPLILAQGDIIRTSGVLPDTGKREDFESGAMREPATGKGRYDLISPFALHRLAQHYENGAKKYSERNWEKGLPAGRMLDSTLRHLTQYMMGNADEDHLAAATWNLFCVMEFEQRLPEMLKDLPMRWRWDMNSEKDVLK